VLGSYVFFLKTQDDTKALKNVQWVYLAIACFVFLLAVVFYLYVHVPFSICLPLPLARPSMPISLYFTSNEKLIADINSLTAHLSPKLQTQTWPSKPPKPTPTPTSSLSENSTVSSTQHLLNSATQALKSPSHHIS
jgi:hypothetical protein